MADIVSKAMSKVAAYQDPPSKKMIGYDWRPLKDVHEELEGLPEIPDYVHNYGDFMHKMAAKAAGPGLSNRDVLKAYAITRSSINRGAISNNIVRGLGLDVPDSPDGKIRPEGAMAEWLKTNMGQRYLDAAEVGRVDPEAVAHAQRVMSSFGNSNNTEGQGLPWAVYNLSGKNDLVTHLVRAGMQPDSPVKEWRDFATKLHGIKYAKSGFIGSLLGRGDQPTFDARQIALHVGRGKDDEEKKFLSNARSRAGGDAVDRLAARQTAMDPRMDPSMERFRQHLTHHAVWDKAENAVTPHDDLMDTMQYAATGGRIGYATDGAVTPKVKKPPMSNLFHHAVVAAAGQPDGSGATLNPELMDHLNQYKDTFKDVLGHGMFGQTSDVSLKRGLKETPQTIAEFNARFAANKPSTLDLNDVAGINDPDRRAEAMRRIAMHDTQTGGKSAATSSYYNVAQSMSPEDVKATVTGIPGVNLKPKNDMSWRDALMPHLGGTLIGLGGDRTRVGRMTHINGKPLAWPVDAHGGVDYMREPNAGQVWANHADHTEIINKMFDKIAKHGSVLGSFNPMGAQSLDSSHNMVDLLLSQIPGAGISDKDLDQFDADIRAGRHGTNDKERATYREVMKNWPGIRNAKAASDFMRPENGFSGTHRSNFVNFMDKKPRREQGFPEVGVTRVALTEPSLLKARGNQTGHRLVKIDPNKLYSHLMNSGYAHSTYPGPTLGDYYADVPDVDRSDIFHNYGKFMLGKAIKGDAAVHPYGEDSQGVGTYRKMTEEQKPWEIINEQLIHRAMTAAQRKAMLGYKRGGTAKNIDRALKLTSLYSLNHDRDAG
jgi:hypothetical protein